MDTTIECNTTLKNVEHVAHILDFYNASFSV